MSGVYATIEKKPNGTYARTTSSCVDLTRAFTNP